jgi:hypothetical protein
VSVLYDGYEGRACESTSRRKNLCGDRGASVKGEATLPAVQGDYAVAWAKIVPISTAANTPASRSRFATGHPMGS